VPAHLAAEALPDRAEQLGAALRLGVAVAVLVDGLDRGLLEQVGHGEVGLPDREVDRVLQMRGEVEDLADAARVDRLGAVREDLLNVEAIGGRRGGGDRGGGHRRPARAARNEA
jgi:hypothetical protein